MELGMVGLGRMGANLVRRLMKAGHTCYVTDIHPEAIEALAAEGAIPARDPEELASKMTGPRAIWVMVPAAIAGRVVRSVAEHLGDDDIIIDGGNSYYRDDIHLAEELGSKGIHFLDVGTSGGVYGLERGFCLMIGGHGEAVQRLEPIWNTLAPGIESAERTPGVSGAHQPGEAGWLHCGPSGAGHFVKMVHNGIEYGMMAAIAEGLNILHEADIGKREREVDAETAPLNEAPYLQYDIDVAAVTEVWRRGSVVSSWLVDLTAMEMQEDPQLDGFAGRVSDSGEGRWTVQAAIAEGVPAPVITAALYQRFSSRGRDDFGNRVLSAMRRAFGGHHEKK